MGLANNATLAFNQADSVTFATPISGTGGLVKAGGGRLTLSGNNFYTGGTTVSGGTLQLGNPLALGSGGLTANAGLVDLNGHNLTTGGTNALAYLSGAAGTITDNNTSGGTIATILTVNQTGNTTFGGSILIGTYAPGISLQKYGSGSLTLGGNSTLAGASVNNNGTLAITGSVTTINSSAASSAATLLVNGGLATTNLSVNGTAQLAGSGTINITSSAGEIDVTSTKPFTFGGTVTGAGGLEADTPASRVTLTGANNYSGATLVDGGAMLTAGSAYTLSPSSAVSVSGTLDVTSSPQTVQSLAMGAGGVLNLSLTNLLTSIGSASLGGTLNLLNLGGLTSGTTEILAYGGYAGSFNSYTSLPRGYNLVYTPSQLDIIGAAATFSGSGTWLGTTTSWSNSANWTDGANPGVPGDGSRPAGTDTAAFSGSGTVTAITLDTNPNLASLTFSNSSYTLSGGSLTLQSSTGTATVTALSGTQTFDGSVALSLATSASFAANNGALIAIAAAVSGSGALSLTGDGTGTLVLGGTNNTYGGGTYVEAGTLVANSSGAVPDNARW